MATESEFEQIYWVVGRRLPAVEGDVLYVVYSPTGEYPSRVDICGTDGYAKDSYEDGAVNYGRGVVLRAGETVDSKQLLRLRVEWN